MQVHNPQDGSGNTTMLDTFTVVRLVYLSSFHCKLHAKLVANTPNKPLFYSYTTGLGLILPYACLNETPGESIYAPNLPRSPPPLLSPLPLLILRERLLSADLKYG